MTTPRLGYACINTVIQDRALCALSSLAGAKPRQRLCVNRSCIAKTLREKGTQYAVELARSNLEAVLTVLAWNENHGIRLYRLSSDMFPHITNPEFIPNGEICAYPLDQFDDLFQKIGAYARRHKHRLTFHPGQFNQVGAKDPKVFQKTFRDLSVHAEILDRMGTGPESVMVVHGGGTYGDKETTIKRWVKQFKQLPKNVRDRIVIENCERQYNYSDMLRISKQIDRPVVFDTHHHACYCDLIEELPDPSTFLDQIVETWTKHGLIPKFHISEQAPDKRIGAHSDFVESIPQYLLDLAKGQEIDIMIEAKAKEQAVLQLYSTYWELIGDFWIKP